MVHSCDDVEINASSSAPRARPPSTNSTEYSGMGGSDWASRSASVRIGSVPRRSLSYRTSSARLRALPRAVRRSSAPRERARPGDAGGVDPAGVGLTGVTGGRSVDPAEVPTVAGVDLDLLAHRE